MNDNKACQAVSNCGKRPEPVAEQRGQVNHSCNSTHKEAEKAHDVLCKSKNVGKVVSEVK